MGAAITLEQNTSATPQEALMNAWTLFTRGSIGADELRRVVESLISARRDDGRSYPDNVAASASTGGATPISEDEIYRAAPQRMGRRQ